MTIASDPVELGVAPVQRTTPEKGTAPLTLYVRFAGDSATAFTAALASLLWNDDADIAAELAVGGRPGDAELSDVLRWNREGKLRELVFSQPAGGVTIRHFVVERAVSVQLEVSSAQGPAETHWLQSDAAYLGPVPVLAVRLGEDGFALEACHGFVGLALRIGGLVGAEAKAGDDVLGQWSVEQGEGSIPVAARQADAVWLPAANGESAELWFRGPCEETIHFDAAEWRSRFDELTAHPVFADLRDCLSECLTQGGLQWIIEPLRDHLATGSFMTVPQTGVVVALVPYDCGVKVAVDIEGCQERLGDVLLHAAGHLALGHVHPGDTYSHWDTLETATAPQPRRRWDRDVRRYLDERFDAGKRKVESIDDCTPREKAMLGLWGMISDILGGTGELHERAKDYQQAAYQLQAAQRLSTMLDSFDGAMLCDGVGLGKTYVATALLVHYANVWRDMYQGTPEKMTEDPYRVTLVVPNSIVSTWKREALPGLAQFGVPLDWVRVISHTKLSKVVASSAVLEPGPKGALSDLEHLLLSDLVVVDEAHHFRSESAKRTLILRDMLRLQPRKDLRRKVLLLTATPINNSLSDLEQQLSLLFSTGLELSDARTPDGYLRQARQTVQTRCTRARSVSSRKEVAALIVHGDIDARFSQALDFRSDLDFGENIFNLAKYLKEENEKLQAYQARVRAMADAGEDEGEPQSLRVASGLLDRVVVQRSRALCKQIEEQENSGVHLLFRQDAEAPSQLRFVDEYDGTTAVLERFLPLFGKRPDSAILPLSFKIYMWYDVREGVKTVDDRSPAVGLQKVLALKRLESSPVSFLISLLRLTVLHAHRLYELQRRCEAIGSNRHIQAVHDAVEGLLGQHSHSHLRMVRWLSLGDSFTDPASAFLANMSRAYGTVQLSAAEDDVPAQLTFEEQLFPEEQSDDTQVIERLWPMLDILVQDLNTLLRVIPDLARIVFNRFDVDAWPGNFIANNQQRVWPDTRAWAHRLTTDAKLRSLVRRLLEARRAEQKVVVFSQFTDSLGYIQSVLRACRALNTDERQAFLFYLEIEDPQPGELDALIDATAVVSGDTEERDQAINSFAPYYRIGPYPPADDSLRDDWEEAWTQAALSPVQVMLATDVLAEGVNLQDVALLINWDIHWNPVKMIQRSGRIDRRLNPRIETVTDYPDLNQLAATRNLDIPPYYWHGRTGEAPQTVNMILPDELEKELELREKIARKTLAIDFTLGLERGTGAEADWLSDYRYRGVASLNAFDRDRAIERLASVQNDFQSSLAAIGVTAESWRAMLNAWLRTEDGDELTPLIATALVGREDAALSRHSRRLRPNSIGGVTCWPWTVQISGGTLRNGYWLVLDGEQFPPRVDTSTPVPDDVSSAVDPVSLLKASEVVRAGVAIQELPPDSVSTQLFQGVTAISAGFFDDYDARAAIDCDQVFVFQYNPVPLEQGTPA
jgi:hypothetical protein